MWQWVCTSDTRSLKLQQPNQHGFVQLCTCRAVLHTWEQKWHIKISKRCICLVYQPSNQTGSNYEITQRQLQELRDKQAFQIYVASCSETKHQWVKQKVMKTEKWADRCWKETFPARYREQPGARTQGAVLWLAFGNLFLTVVSLTSNDVQWGSGTITPCHRSASILCMNKAVGMMYAWNPETHNVFTWPLVETRRSRNWITKKGNAHLWSHSHSSSCSFI